MYAFVLKKQHLLSLFIMLKENIFTNCFICLLYIVLKSTKLLYFHFFFSIVTKQKIYFVQTPNERELYDWLYAINPLLAGQIRYHNVRVYGKYFKEVFCNIIMQNHYHTNNISLYLILFL